MQKFPLVPACGFLCGVAFTLSLLFLLQPFVANQTPSQSINYERQ